MKLFRVLLWVDGPSLVDERAGSRSRDVIVIAHTAEGALDVALREAREREGQVATLSAAMSDIVEVILDSARLVAYEV